MAYRWHLRTGMQKGRMPIVYIATNTINGGEYIGCTKGSMARRRYIHERDASSGRGRGAFPKALRKHGPAAFTWAVHKEFATREEAFKEEIRMIAERRPRYNSTKGGEGYAPRQMSLEMRARISALHRGNKYRLGIPHSDETRKKLRVIGVRDASKWATRSHLGPAAIARKVICLNDRCMYASASEAARAYGAKKSAVIEVCLRNPRRNTAAGMTFRYVDDALESDIPVQVQHEPRKNNRSGYRGVYAVGRKWRAERRIAGKSRKLGMFDTPEAAHEAYMRAGGAHGV